MKQFCGLWVVLAAFACIPASAQQSASFKLEEYVLNSGGNPVAGVEPQSSGFRLSLSSLGEGIVTPTLGSASHTLGGGFVSPYRPPGEVENMRFLNKTTLIWDPEISTGSYSLYREALTNIVGSGFGSCEQQQLPSATATDSDPVSLGSGFFYLVTANNLLSEEGTKGFNSDTTERPNSAPCP